MFTLKHIGGSGISRVVVYFDFKAEVSSSGSDIQGKKVSSEVPLTDQELSDITASNQKSVVDQLSQASNSIAAQEIANEQIKQNNDAEDKYKKQVEVTKELNTDRRDVLSTDAHSPSFNDFLNKQFAASSPRSFMGSFFRNPDKGQLQSMQKILSALNQMVTLGKPIDKLSKAELTSLKLSKDEKNALAGINIGDLKDSDKAVIRRLATTSLDGVGSKQDLQKHMHALNAETDLSTILSQRDFDAEITTKLDGYHMTEQQVSHILKFHNIDPKIAFKNVTGKEPGKNNVANSQLFWEGLRDQASMLQFLSGGEADSGLAAILSGDTEKFGVEIMKKVENLKEGEKIMINVPQTERGKRFLKNVLSGIGSAAVALITLGQVTFFRKERSLLAEKQNDGKTSSKFKEGLVKTITSLRIPQGAEFVSKLLAGDIFSLKFGDEGKIDQVLSSFKQKMDSYDLQQPGSIEGLKQNNSSVKALLQIYPRATNTDIINYLTYNAVLQAHEGKAGSDWSFRVSPFFLGAHNASVKNTSEAGNASGENGTKEQELTRKNIELAQSRIQETEKDGKYVYTLDIKDLKNVDVVWKGVDGKILQNPSFDKKQSFAITNEIGHNKTVVTIQAQEMKTEIQEQKMNMEVSQDVKIVAQRIMNSLLHINSTEIRQNYRALQQDILNATNSGDPQAVDKVLKQLGDKLKIDQKQSENLKTIDKVMVLNMILGELAGDGRLRAIRLIQSLGEGGSIPAELKKEKITITPTKGKPYQVDGPIYSVLASMKDSKGNYLQKTAITKILQDDKQIRSILGGINMGQVYDILDAYKTGGEKSNETYTRNEMSKRGISPDLLSQVQQNYRDGIKEKKAYDTTPRTADAFGVMVNHQVFGNGDKQRVNFSGLSAIWPNDQIQAYEPVPLIGADVSKFIDAMPDSQIAQLKPLLEGLQKTAGLSGEVDVKQILKDGKIGNIQLNTGLSYAEYPNCTNTVVLMKITAMNSVTKQEVVVSTSGALANVTNTMTTLGIGVNPVAIAMQNPPKPKQKEASNPQSQPANDTTNNLGDLAPKDNLVGQVDTSTVNISNLTQNANTASSSATAIRGPEAVLSNGAATAAPAGANVAAGTLSATPGTPAIVEAVKVVPPVAAPVPAAIPVPVRGR